MIRKQKNHVQKKNNWCTKEFFLVYFCTVIVNFLIFSVVFGAEKETGGRGEAHEAEEGS
jgi:hypothetical protein